MEAVSIDVLARSALDALKDSGASAKTLWEYEKTGFAELCLRFEARGQAVYSRELADTIVCEARAELDAGVMRPTRWGAMRRAADVLAAFAATGGIERPRSPWWGLRQPGEAFGEHLDQFAIAAAALGWREATIASARSAVRQFLFAAEDAGISSVGELTPGIVSDTVTVVARRLAAGLGHWLFAVRAFLRHLHHAGATSVDLSLSVPVLPAPRRVVQEGFTAEEVQTLLGSASGNTTIDRRDLAIMTLAAHTGLRGGDLTRLRRGDLDWRAGEIRLVQSKTQTPLSLPLDAASGNAIAAYLLTDRISGDSEFVFVTCTKPVRPLGPRAISMIVSQRMRRCGLDGVSPRRGAHSLRRTLGAQLLEAGTPIDTLRQVLGHTRIDSVRPYLSISEQGLRDCAISLAAITGGR